MPGTTNKYHPRLWTSSTAPSNRINMLPIKEGQRINDWIILSNKPVRPTRYEVRVKCRCALCDKISTPFWIRVKRGLSKRCMSCSASICGQQSAVKKWGRILDADDRLLYGRWRGIKTRCEDPRHKQYSYYGGSGIRLSKEFQDYVSFVNYCKNLPSYHHSLEVDRIETDKGYERGNIVFSNRGAQLRNRKITVFTTYKGKKYVALDFAAEFIKKLHPVYVVRLAKKGMTGEQILEREKNPLKLRKIRYSKK